MTQRISGCLFGLAIGDAMGAPVEFMYVDEIVRRWPPSGPTDLLGSPARVTDDTQMALAVGEALAQVMTDLRPGPVASAITERFVDSYGSPENNRAPGMTCLTACANLASGKPWIESTIMSSKGCGANMRVAPVGLIDCASRPITEPQRAAIAQLQAAMTHGHPTALAAADLTAYAIADLASGGDAAGLIDRLGSYADSQETVYHENWLLELWRQADCNSPAEFISAGWQECKASLERVRTAMWHPDGDADPCKSTGAGWTAEEALATGLYCFLMFPDTPIESVRRAAVSSGDSDSIAAIAGSLAGAYNGIHAWPDDWLERIEYRDRIRSLSKALAGG